MTAHATSDHAAIHAVATRLLAAVNAGDVPGIVACWAHDGVMLPPYHPAVSGHAAIAAYFRRVFATRRLAFTFTGSVVTAAGALAVERLAYTSAATPVEGGVPTLDEGKGLHVYTRRPDGTWVLAQDIWNSDRPLLNASATAVPPDAIP